MATDTASTDPSFENMLELDLPVSSVAPVAPKAAPAITARPVPVSTLQAATMELQAATTVETCEQAMHAIAAGPVGKLHREDPLRVELRRVAKARLALLVLALVWRRAFHMLAVGIEQRPALIVRPAITTTTAGRDPVASGLDLVQALTSIGAEGASNASVQALGSMAGGQLRGVGFSDAAGYVGALAHGVKRATAEGYKQILRATYHYTPEQIAALTVTIIAEAALPEGVGITHVPQGKAVSDMTRAEAAEHFRSKSPAEQAKLKAKAEAAAAEEHAASLQSLAIAGLVAEGEGLIVSPGDAVHGVVVPRAELITQLGDRADLAPRIKSNVAQFGEVMRGIGSSGLRSRAAKKRNASDWPADVASRWIVERPDDAAALGSSGDKELIAELLTEGEIRFVGGSIELRERVVDAFVERIGTQSYNPTDLLRWLRDQVLVGVYSAVRYGGFHWVPGAPERVTEVRNLIDRVLPIMGREIGLGEVANKSSMAAGIARTLIAEVAAVRRTYDANLAEAQRNAGRKVASEGPAAFDLAARRAEVSSTVAANRLADLGKVAARVEGFAALLGPELHTPIKASVDSFREMLRGLCDFVELELT